MKQYVFSPRPNPKPITGGERFHLEVLSHLEQFGDQVNCISLKDTPYIFRNKFLYNFWLMWKMRNYHRSTFILDFYYHPWCFLSVWAIRYLFKCKIVVSARGIYFIDKGLVVYWLSFLMAFILLKTSDLVIVNSEWTKRELVKRGAKNKKFKIVYPGVELPKERAKKTRKNVSNKTHLLSVGNCIPMKGIDLLIEAVSMLPKEKYHLTIMGETKDDLKYFNRVMDLIKAKGLENNVTFAGYVKGDKKWEIYRNADIYLNSSLAEGFGIVLIEAMYFGLPIVANRVGAIPELVKENINGFLVSFNDSESFSKSVKTLILDKGLREKMGGMSKKIFSEKAFTWEQTINKFTRVLSNVS